MKKQNSNYLINVGDKIIVKKGTPFYFYPKEIKDSIKLSKQKRILKTDIYAVREIRQDGFVLTNEENEYIFVWNKYQYTNITDIRIPKEKSFFYAFLSSSLNIGINVIVTMATAYFIAAFLQSKFDLSLILTLNGTIEFGLILSLASIINIFLVNMKVEDRLTNKSKMYMGIYVEQMLKYK